MGRLIIIAGTAIIGITIFDLPVKDQVIIYAGQFVAMIGGVISWVND